MPIRGKLSTKGFEEFLERIARAGRDIDAAADRALADGGQVLVGGMKQRAPKDTHNLENHLVMDGPKQDGNYHYIEVGLVGADAETARYGTAQEYGTSSMAAQPYIRPTLDRDMRKARGAMKAVFEEEGML